MHVSSCLFVQSKSFSHRLFTVKGLFPEDLHSLQAVEYVAKEPKSAYVPVKSVVLEIHVYHMSSNLEYLEDDGTLLQAEIIQLPSLRFEGIWEGLVSLFAS